MKVLLLTLLLLVCSTQVLTLKCYTCDEGPDPDCKRVTDCPELSSYCKTFTKDDDFSRSCEETCVEDDFTICCTTDLCEI